MDACVLLYLKQRKEQLERVQLRRMAADLSKAQDDLRPLIEAKLKREKETRSKGDGFVIVST